MVSGEKCTPVSLLRFTRKQSFTGSNEIKLIVQASSCGFFCALDVTQLAVYIKCIFSFNHNGIKIFKQLSSLSYNTHGCNLVNLCLLHPIVLYIFSVTG